MALFNCVVNIERFRPLATVVTEVLDKRKAAGQEAAALDEIYKELLAGGFQLTISR